MRGSCSSKAIAASALVLLSCTLPSSDGQERRPDERATPASAAGAAPASKPVPRLLDLGAGKCIPCKAMAPILEQLRVDYAGRLEVRFIDVWKSPDEAQPYGIRMIPTQIFYAADGRELARHEGFISREGILGTWKSLGVEL
jgi:thioredoxin 1